MGIIWLIENPKESAAISGELCANFPVRTVASLDSLGKLLMIEGQFLPNLIIYRCPVELKHQNAIQLIRCHSDVPVVIVSETENYHLSIEEKYIVFPKLMEISSLFSIIRRLVRREAVTNSHESTRRYKHIVLDHTSLHLQSDCGAISEKLPSKEAGILQILMNSNGECVTRDLITERLWQDVKVGPRTVDAHISRLRRRLLNAGVQIDNVYGSGYLLK